MKNALINESISFESTLGSPSKPQQDTILKKPKQIFLVKFVNDNTISLSPNKISNNSSPVKKLSRGKRTKFKNTPNPIAPNNKNDKNSEYHLLDFDALFDNIIIGKKKPEVKKEHRLARISRKKNNKKIIGLQRFKIFSSKNVLNKSKSNYFLL
jgi:hypothetical protein